MRCLVPQKIVMVGAIPFALFEAERRALSVFVGNEPEW